MKITFTSDFHLDFLKNPHKSIEEYIDYILKESSQVICMGGDYINTNLSNIQQKLLIHKFFTIHPNTTYIFGNHDLWINNNFNQKLPPDQAYIINQENFFKYGFLLEKSINDTETFYTKDDCIFIGTIGFPDFMHPKLICKPSFYDTHSFTNDARYMDLSLGWLHYTNQIQNSFYKRLDKALQRNEKNIFIITHYNILPNQCEFTGSKISAYFYNYSIGQHIIKTSKKYPNKTFWCLSGHSHEYCKGQLKMEEENVYSFGLQTDYGQLALVTIDTELDLYQDIKICIIKNTI